MDTIKRIFASLALVAAALGGWFVDKGIATVDQGQQISAASENATNAIGSLLALIVAALIGWLITNFRGGKNGNSKPPGGALLLLVTMTAACFCALPSCGPNGVPVDIRVDGTYGTYGYSSKGGLALDVDLPKQRYPRSRYAKPVPAAPFRVIPAKPMRTASPARPIIP